MNDGSNDEALALCKYFARRGFVAIERASLPDELRASSELGASVCATANAMALRWS